MVCKSCGKENPEGTKFCTGCGAPIEEPSSVEQATQRVEAASEQAKESFAKAVDVVSGAVEDAVVENKTLSIVSMVLGILSILCCNPCLLFSIAGVITGIIGMKKGGKPFAIAGIITSAVGIVVFIFAAFLGVFSSTVGSILESM